jgi:hypothetical protein
LTELFLHPVPGSAMFELMRQQAGSVGRLNPGEGRQ